MQLQPFTFMRPIGPSGYGYCYLVTDVSEDEGGDRWRCTRWGMHDKLPYDDGHIKAGHAIGGLSQVAPGVWRQRHEQGCYPYHATYWREVKSPWHQARQADLFA